LPLRATGPVAIVAMITLVAGACTGDRDSAPVPTPSAGSTATASSAAPATAACATIPPSSPGEPTLYDELTRENSGAGNLHPELTVEVSDDSAGANADLTFSMTLPEDDMNFMAFFITIPPAWGITPGCAIPLGATVGTLSWLATLGIYNGACRTALPIRFTMQNASTDPSQIMDFVDDQGELVPDFDQDKDGSGLLDVVERYPDLLDSLFAGRAPVRRTVGVAKVVRTPVIVQSLVFPALDRLSGQIMVILFHDASNPRTAVGRSAITDQCTPFVFTMTDLGTGDDGSGLQTNPGAGTHTFALTGFGLRDADGDDIENALDTCPFDPNVGNPRVLGDGDADSDGLDAACDPNDLSSNFDEDGDLTLNRGDLCPLTPGDPSGSQKDSDSDQIGDECDIFGNGPDVPDGDLSLASATADVVIR
jgi:hypothetical protein